jgi:hypothetical protein
VVVAGLDLGDEKYQPQEEEEGIGGRSQQRRRKLRTPSSRVTNQGTAF